MTHIEESPALGLLVRGITPGKAAALSPFVDGYAELRGELSAWKPIASVSQAQVGRRMDAAGLLGLVLGLGICLLWMGVGYFSDLRWAMLSGTAMVACGVAGLLYLRRSAPQLRLKPLISALVFFSLAIPARLFVHFYWPK
ncbi:hypothetical protein D7V97_29180 [Corallococcus sp. CA053C]|uniref:hypothetical protein n=1 Tax=Corallococcus sp. CA053C TaxID=2316732 RepID=UPI000EA14E77|nr:hypothetical protein [Corallococcus sp. CA053C]RKH01321.1 hypothetical protein D7V97_29180 [Corallococcus sp. CA053C]